MVSSYDAAVVHWLGSVWEELWTPLYPLVPGISTALIVVPVLRGAGDGAGLREVEGEG
jgi:hypothetical protein